jgi:hypothetical protein
MQQVGHRRRPMPITNPREGRDIGTSVSCQTHAERFIAKTISDTEVGSL